MVGSFLSSWSTSMFPDHRRKYSCSKMRKESRAINMNQLNHKPVVTKWLHNGLGTYTQSAIHQKSLKAFISSSPTPAAFCQLSSSYSSKLLVSPACETTGTIGGWQNTKESNDTWWQISIHFRKVAGRNRKPSSKYNMFFCISHKTISWLISFRARTAYMDNTCHMSSTPI